MQKQSRILFKCDALLFDFDGVLVDSTGNILRHWKAWADRHGIDMNEINKAVHGMRAIETMRIVAPHLNLEEEVRLFMENELHDTEGIIAYEGARDLLSTLPTNAWAVVTSARMELVRLRLVTTGLPVPQVLIAADDVREGKPSPEPYLAGSKKIGVLPERCMVVEDAPAGIRAGKRAGMFVTAIASTHSADELLACGADIALNRLVDLRVEFSNDGYRMQISAG